MWICIQIGAEVSRRNVTRKLLYEEQPLRRMFDWLADRFGAPSLCINCNFELLLTKTIMQCVFFCQYWAWKCVKKIKLVPNWYEWPYVRFFWYKCMSRSAEFAVPDSCFSVGGFLQPIYKLYGHLASVPSVSSWTIAATNSPTSQQRPRRRRATIRPNL